jgi:peptide/nickel transport system permease protein
VAVMGPSLGHLIFALSLTAWTGFARLVRGEVMHLKSREFAVASKAAGAGALRIVTTHLWPNLAGLVAVQFASAMAATVIAESGLSFLGLGVSASTPTWGALLNSGRRVLSEAPHLSLAPGLCLMLLVLGFNLLADGLRDALDPRRSRRS